MTIFHFQSDGPTTQYKNKTNFLLFQNFCERNQLNNATYHITAPSHGKSTVDAARDTIKSLCDRSVASDKDVTSAKQIINVVESAISKIKMFLISEDINKIDFSTNVNIKLLPNTKKSISINLGKRRTKNIKT